MITTDVAADRWFLGTRLRIVEDGTGTAGQLGLFEQHAPRDFSPPLHLHRHEDTAILLLEGSLTVQVGDERRLLEPGDFAWLPRGVPHTFRVDSDGARLYELALPPDVIGFQLDASEPAAGPGLPPPSEPDVAMLAAAGARYGAELIGPPLAPGD